MENTGNWTYRSRTQSFFCTRYIKDINNIITVISIQPNKQVRSLKQYEQNEKRKWLMSNTNIKEDAEEEEPALSPAKKKKARKMCHIKGKKR